MLQDYPTQIQPRPSSTRETQEQDAEASRTLIDLANQDTSLHSFVNKDDKLLTKAWKKGDVGISINNTHHRLQPDPIMLLAAAAAVLDKEGKYNGRSFERKEIKLQTRRHSTSVTKKKPLTSANLYRRQSEKRHRYQRQHSTDTWTSKTITLEEDDVGLNDNNSQHTFSWQYLSMKQNPRIKRNAMHAYITYMIYTDKANDQNTNSLKTAQNKDDSWRVQSYQLPPSPKQQDSSPPRDSANQIIGRPLTEFLFDNQRPPSPSNNKTT